MNIFSKIHGTTADRFRIGTKSQLLTLVGETTSDLPVQLEGRDVSTFTATSTLFFTAYIVGQGTTNTAAYEIKGCYIDQTNTVQGYVVNTYVDTGNFTDPVISFDSNKGCSISCTGLAGETISWTAIIDFVIV